MTDISTITTKPESSTLLQLGTAARFQVRFSAEEKGPSKDKDDTTKRVQHREKSPIIPNPGQPQRGLASPARRSAGRLHDPPATDFNRCWCWPLLDTSPRNLVHPEICFRSCDVFNGCTSLGVSFFVPTSPIPCDTKHRRVGVVLLCKDQTPAGGLDTEEYL